MKKILFYDDAPCFGGHEVTAVEAIKYLLNFQPDIKVSFIYWEQNKRLEDRLDILKKESRRIEMYPISYKWEDQWKNFKHLLLSSQIKISIQKLMQMINPDLVIVVQGTIHISSLGLLCSKKCGYKTISFIPMAHHFRVTGIRSALLYIISRYLYRQPSQFITTSETAKQQLIKWGVVSLISVAFYGVDINQYEIKDKIRARQKLGLSDSKYIIALIGRIQFGHKAQDFLIETIYAYKDALKNIHWLIVGDGPDSNQLTSMISKMELNNSVKILPWIDDLSDIYSAIDMLVIPSRLEGTPLVMLEAMYYELPIVASNIDGMAEILPKEWLFPAGNSWSLIEAVLQQKDNQCKTLILENKYKVLNMFNWERYGQSFYKIMELSCSSTIINK
jgi:glycosyltransferase involved in cell wall biosynthesis